ncbi:hypothetical protein DFJ43DRAFT_1160765 [Lentinula guzmanii]|uniref:Uncharacterized protein n=1 Tax=Lentinula guzmanii TaxID=2804957 RepID=A0AA38J881_9AGAR|nr:hypothetical protein DFJ43DRAFT_1160765 [Lentinula guzmanii]
MKRRFSGSSENTRKQQKRISIGQCDSALLKGIAGYSLQNYDIPTLTNLFDFSNQETAASIQIRFDEIARHILHHLSLVIRSSSGILGTFEVLELEFYLWKSVVHEDPFTHGSAEQAKSGNWQVATYFHRAPQKSNKPENSPTVVTGGYRGGTRKGLDITIGPSATIPSPYFSALPTGDANSSTRGGILLRTLRETSTGRVISGPSLVVDEILKLSCANSISDLVDKQWKGNISAFRGNEQSSPGEHTLHFMFTHEVETQAVYLYKSPRIGLGLSHPSVSPSLPTPTFIGILNSLQAMCSSDSLHGLDERETKEITGNICNKCGLKAHTVTKYLEYYLGKLDDRSDLESFIGASSKDSPSAYLRLMGILSNKSQGDKS